MKRICAIILSLAMLISVMPASALASEETKEATHTHKECRDENCTEEHEEITYTAWTDSTSLPRDGGNYYLDTDVTLSKNAGITGKLHLCLNGHKVNLNGFVIYLNSKAYICDCTAQTGQDGTYTAGSIYGGKRTSGGAVDMATGRNYIELHLYDGIITGCSAMSNGGAVNVTDNAKFYMYGGRICDNTAGNAGGAVFVNGKGQFYMYGGTIAQNTAKVGGAIAVYNAVADLKNGIVADNTATGDGGAIRANGTSAITLTGMSITNNTGANGSALRLENTATGTIIDSKITGNKKSQAIQMVTASNTLKLEGNTQIFGNEVANLYLLENHPGVDVSGLSDGATVGVTLAPERISAAQMYITGEMMEGVDPSAYVVSDNNEYEVKLVDKKLVLKQHKHADAVGQGEENLYLPWTDSTSLPISGDYYLTTDVELSENAAFTKKLHLCLNGHKVNLNGNQIWNQTTVYICDCTAKTENGTYTAGSIFGGNATTGGAVNMKAGTTYVALHLYDGIIENCIAESNGGAVNVPQGAKFYMYGGTIRGCQAANGGAVYVASGAQFQMTGGTIDNNNATTYGGAVYAESASTAIVSNNTSIITNNTAGKEAGGLYARENSAITIKGSIISGNRANAGSAVTVYGGTLTLDGATIRENHSNNGFGAVHATVTGDNTPEINLKGGVIITENTAGKEGEEKKASNLYLREYDYYVNAGELSEGAQIGVTMDARRITNGFTDIAKNLSETEIARVAGYFISDDSALAVVNKKTTISLFKLDSVEYISVQPELTDSIALNFKVWVGTSLLETEPEMTFVMSGKTLKAGAGMRIESESTAAYAVYTFKCSGIMAQNMADKITASLKAGTGMKTKTYSVMDYCKEVLAMDEIAGYNEAQLAALKTMIVDLVCYGAAVQIYRDPSTASAALLTADLTSEQLALATEDTELSGLEGVVSQKLTGDRSEEYEWTGVTLVLKEKTNIRCRFTARNIENLRIEIKAGSEVVSTKNKDDFKLAGDNTYTVDFDNIYAYEYGKELTFVFYNGDAQTGETLHYSVNTYLKAKEDDQDVNLVSLLHKINNYGNAAKSYHSLLSTQESQ